MFIISILLCVLTIAVINALIFYILYNYSFLEPIKWTLIITLYVVLIDGIVAFIVRKLLNERHFSINKKNFIAKEKEILFYEKIGVKKWKDKVLELGFLAGFSKRKIKKPTDNEYVERYIIEVNYGICVHFFSVPFGFIILFLCPKVYVFSIAFIVAIVNAFYNFLPFAILRYNLVKLHKLYNLNKRKVINNISSCLENNNCA